MILATSCLDAPKMYYGPFTSIQPCWLVRTNCQQRRVRV